MAVSDGIVTLQGHPDSIAEGRRIITEIRQLDGVVAVRDQLTYPDTARTRPDSVSEVTCEQGTQ